MRRDDPFTYEDASGFGAIARLLIRTYRLFTRRSA